MAGWIGVDLDGTLALYTGGPVDGPIGEPVPKMLERVKQMLAAGEDVRIFTARAGRTEAHTYASYYDGTADTFHAKQEQLITEWCIEHLGCALPITATKDFMMVQLWDDRCIQVEANTGRTIHDLFADQVED